MGGIRGKNILNWLTALYSGSAGLVYRNARRTDYVVGAGEGSELAVQGGPNDRFAYESEAGNEMSGYDNDDEKKPVSKKKICIRCILGVAVLLCIGSLFFYNFQSGKGGANPYRLEKPVFKEVAEPLQDSGTVQFTKFLSAESGGNLDTVMAFFSPSIVRFQKLLAPNQGQIEDYYRNEWRTAGVPQQTLKGTQKINRRTYLFTISENSVATADMPGAPSYEVVKRVIFNNHYRILSIKTIDTLSSD